jgi:flagellar biogenesis protein FliO
MAGTAAASYGDLLVTSLVVLGGVCIAAFVVVRLAGRFLATGRTRGAHLLDVVARVPLEPRRSLYVVEVAGKTLLVGTSEMGLSVLSELDGGEVRARVVERPSFADMVREAWLRRRGRGAATASASSEESLGSTAPPTGEPTSAGSTEAGAARSAESRTDTKCPTGDREAEPTPERKVAADVPERNEPASEAP